MERLQDISEADAIAEGIERDGDGWKACRTVVQGPHKGQPHPWNVSPNRSPVTSYQELWNSINADRGYGWDVNPWVWVVEFKRITP